MTGGNRQNARVRLRGALLGVAGLMFSWSASAAVTDHGNGLVYDSTLNATWLQDANTFTTMYSGGGGWTGPTGAALVNGIIAAVPVVHDTPNHFDNDGPGLHAVSADDFKSSGRMDWWGAQAWVGYLNSIDYKGSKQWALPAADPSCGFNYQCTNSQVGELYYSALGNLGYPTHGWGLANAGPFRNLQSDIYWSGTEYAPLPGAAWDFVTEDGRQFAAYMNSFVFAEAVSPGDVAAVPEPGTAGLLGLGLGLGLGAALVARRKRPAGG